MKLISFLKSALVLLLMIFPTTIFAAVLVKDKMWPNNTTLKVVFLDGNSAQKALVKQFAPLWVENSSLRFKFFDSLATAPENTHIRISFKSHTGSMLGNHGDYLSKTATLVLNELTRSELVIHHAKRYVLHEFGHALGFEHEYRNPKWPYGDKPINQQVKQCTPRLIQLGYKDNQAYQKCLDINLPLAKKLVNATIYDESSIMNYPQVITLADETEKQIVAKFSLSVLDKLAIQRWYGK